MMTPTLSDVRANTTCEMAGAVNSALGGVVAGIYKQEFIDSEFEANQGSMIIVIRTILEPVPRVPKISASDEGMIVRTGDRCREAAAACGAAGPDGQVCGVGRGRAALPGRAGRLPAW